MRFKEAPFEELIGKILKRVDNNADEIVFETTEGEKYRQIYHQDCCAGCSVEDICGDLSDLIDTPILMADESSSNEAPEGASAPEYREDSETWTFYKLATAKGYVTIRWYGSSNGYYSEAPSFEKLCEG